MRDGGCLSAERGGERRERKSERVKLKDNAENLQRPNAIRKTWTNMYRMCLKGLFERALILNLAIFRFLNKIEMSFQTDFGTQWSTLLNEK